jgi:sortase (surface protein transpeptidase)
LECAFLFTINSSRTPLSHPHPAKSHQDTLSSASVPSPRSEIPSIDMQQSIPSKIAPYEVKEGVRHYEYRESG